MKKPPIYSLYKKISDILGEMMNNRNEKKNPKIEFFKIYITPQYRRKGIGSYVYKEIEKTFLSIGCNWWSSYPKFDGADVFALAVGFDYTNINHELEHNGNLVSINTEGIRKCSVSDFHEVTELWGTEYARMHTLLGFPFQRKELNDEEKKESYEDFCNNIDNYL